MLRIKQIDFPETQAQLASFEQLNLVFEKVQFHSMMLFPSDLSFIATLASLLSLVYATNSHGVMPISSDLPFNFKYLFTGHLTLAEPLPSISIPGGVLITKPIANGTVEGPYINGTIQGGFATPSIYNNGTLLVLTFRAWGITSDGAAFVVNEAGTGTITAEVTRLQLDIGGGEEYALLRDGFLLAAARSSADGTEVTVQGYLVENSLTLP